jgi:lipopolysaccharide export system permease protein
MSRNGFKKEISYFYQKANTPMNTKADKLKAFDNPKLFDTIKNHKQYGYDDDIRNSAIEILKSRGIDEDDLKLSGNFENKQFNSASEISDAYSRNSLLALLFYCLIWITIIFTKLSAYYFDSFTFILRVASILSPILFIIFLIKSFLNYFNFYQAIGKKAKGDPFIYFIIGMPLYVFIYFHNRQTMVEETRLIR